MERIEIKNVKLRRGDPTLTAQESMSYLSLLRKVMTAMGLRISLSMVQLGL